MKLSQLALYCRFLPQCDGAIFVNPPIIEPTGLEAAKDWFRESGRPLYAIGPFIPPRELRFSKVNIGEKDVVRSSTEVGKRPEVMEFLDKMLDKHGRNSLIYVRSSSGDAWPQSGSHNRNA